MGLLESSCVSLLCQVKYSMGSLRSSALGSSTRGVFQIYLYSGRTVNASSSDGRADLFVIAQIVKCALKSVKVAEGCSLAGGVLYGRQCCVQVTAMLQAPL